MAKNYWEIEENKRKNSVGTSKSPPCIGNHRHCRCRSCQWMRCYNREYGYNNTLLGRELDPDGIMTEAELRTWKANTTKFQNLVEMIESQKEQSGFFWGILGQDKTKAMICDPEDVDDILQKFLQFEINIEGAMDLLKKARVEKVLENSEELTREILKKAWRYYCPKTISEDDWMNYCL